MTEEEYFRKNYPDSCYGDKPLSPHWDFFQDGVEFGERQSEKRIEELEQNVDYYAKRAKSAESHIIRQNKRIVDLEKEIAELKEKLAGAERAMDNLRQIGFPTFQSCKEYADKLNYAKAIIKDLLNNSDEYARQRAIDFLKEE